MDRGKVQAADRLAALIACSFPRAELTRLGHQIVEHDKDANAELAAALGEATTTPPPPDDLQCQDIEPLDLAARARIVIDNADHSSPGELADLLQLADT